MTAEELIAKAAACHACGREHEYHWVSADRASWRAPDGHQYRPALSTGVVALLRYLAGGTFKDPWLKPAGHRGEPG